MRLLFLISATLVGFSANSLLTRGALGNDLLDPASFTVIRLATGALTLLLLVQLRSSSTVERGSWWGGALLVGYAIAFTLAYVRIGAAIGALLLFAGVQITMIGIGLMRGERPARVDWVGVVLAIGGLLVLTLPGTTAPNGIGAVLMVTAGVFWGIYSLAGRTGRDPLGRTTGNFVRASVLALPFLVVAASGVHLTSAGVWLAVLSGSLASGVAYTLWYMTLPHLAAWRAAIIQLIVPILTALAAVPLLDETITPRLVAATALVALGVWLTVWPRAHAR